MKDQNNNNAKAEHRDAVWSSKYGRFKKKGGNNNTFGQCESEVRALLKNKAS